MHFVQVEVKASYARGSSVFISINTVSVMTGEKANAATQQLCLLSAEAEIKQGFCLTLDSSLWQTQAYAQFEFPINVKGGESSTSL